MIGTDAEAALQRLLDSTRARPWAASWKLELEIADHDRVSLTATLQEEKHHAERSSDDTQILGLLLAAAHGACISGIPAPAAASIDLIDCQFSKQSSEHFGAYIVDAAVTRRGRTVVFVRAQIRAEQLDGAPATEAGLLQASFAVREG